MPAPVSRLFSIACLFLLLPGGLCPSVWGAETRLAEEKIPPAVPEKSVGRELLRLTSEMWFLLSGIRDKQDADAAAPRFEALVEQSSNMGDKLYDESSHAQELESLEMLHYCIAEAYEDLSYEFDSLCRTRCYGSERLLKAFHKAVDAGLFNDEELPMLELAKPPLTESEARHELVRLKRLVEPDRAVLRILSEVKDARSARQAAGELSRQTARLKLLLPESKIANRSFADSSQASVRAAYKPIEPLLWGIRNEIVRIASLPGYESESFDSFSDALELMFESLGKTHSEWFHDVFDASFRTDLDDAIQENATTSN